jgi:hypothetical protein
LSTDDVVDAVLKVIDLFVAGDFGLIELLCWEGLVECGSNGREQGRRTFCRVRRFVVVCEPAEVLVFYPGHPRLVLAVVVFARLRLLIVRVVLFLGEVLVEGKDVIGIYLSRFCKWVFKSYRQRMIYGSRTDR